MKHTCRWNLEIVLILTNINVKKDWFDQKFQVKFLNGAYVYVLST
jgi:hypothetical protein